MPHRISLVVVVALCGWLSADPPKVHPTTGRAAPLANKDYDQWMEARGLVAATDAGAIRARPGFSVELLRSAREGEGSWISLEFDPKGRLLIGKEGKQDGTLKGILRVTLGETPNDAVVESVDESLQECRGLLWAFDALYAQCNVSTPNRPSGLYRLRDTDGDDRFDDITLLHAAPGGGHGLNDLALGPDGFLYLIQGDQSSLPKDWDPSQSRVPHPGHDVLADPFGKPYPFAPTRPLDGRLIRTDREGKLWEVIACGMRNPYGLDFNADGEPFTYEADMELDVGLPWYRPTHLIHLVSGADYGWRQGEPSSLFAPDRPPPSLIVGLGSPTTVKFGTHSRFPDKYRRALYILDWAYGRIIAVHMTPQGASYACEAELFLDGRPLNVTDLAFGPDGAMYFVTGGRGTQSGLYRVKSMAENPAPLGRVDRPASAGPRDLRRWLETFHGHRDQDAITDAWPHLSRPDPWVRHAARRAVESQPVESWRDRALAETDPTAAIELLIALARAAPPADQPRILDRLTSFDLATLEEGQKLSALRACELCLHRMGSPPAPHRESLVKWLEAIYPTSKTELDRELLRLLTYLGAEGLVEKTIPLLAHAEGQGEKLALLNGLRNSRSGWTAPNVTAGFEALAALRAMHGGRAYPGFVQSLISDLLARLPADQLPAAQRILESTEHAPVAAITAATGRKFVRNWTAADLQADLAAAGQGRNPDRGRQLFVDAACSQCHRVGALGNVIGPDLTAVSSRFGRLDILRSILEPSAAIDPKYQVVVVTTDAGEVFAGQVIAEDDRTLTLTRDPLRGDRVPIDKTKITAHEASPVSPMPPGLLNTLTKEEVLDLLAWIESGGKSGTK